MKKSAVFFASWAISLTLAIAAFFAYAADSAALPSPQGVPLTIDRVLAILAGLSCWFARVAGTLVLIAVLFYAIQIALSRDNQEKFASARKSLGWAIVGGLVIFGVYIIMATVINAVGGTDYSLLPTSCGFSENSATTSSGGSTPTPLVKECNPACPPDKFCFQGECFKK